MGYTGLIISHVLFSTPMDSVLLCYSLPAFGHWSCYYADFDFSVCVEAFPSGMITNIGEVVLLFEEGSLLHLLLLLCIFVAIITFNGFEKEKGIFLANITINSWGQTVLLAHLGQSRELISHSRRPETELLTWLLLFPHFLVYWTLFHVWMSAHAAIITVHTLKWTLYSHYHHAWSMKHHCYAGCAREHSDCYQSPWMAAVMVHKMASLMFSFF